MRQETLEQILKVISLAAQRYSIGDRSRVRNRLPDYR